MVIDSKTRENLRFLLDGVNYRQIVAEKVGCHPNTVGNVLNNGHDNLAVAVALLELAQEQKATKEKEQEQKQKAEAIMKQISPGYKKQSFKKTA
jgi:hypothetical protein